MGMPGVRPVGVRMAMDMSGLAGAPVFPVFAVMEAFRVHPGYCTRPPAPVSLVLPLVRQFDTATCRIN